MLGVEFDERRSKPGVWVKCEHYDTLTADLARERARSARLAEALEAAREYLLNSPYRASDTSGKEWNRIMDSSGAALEGAK